MAIIRFYYIVEFLYNIGIPALAFVAFVLGLISLTGKNKNVHLLCVWTAVSAFTTMTAKYSSTLMYLYNRGWIFDSDSDGFYEMYRGTVSMIGIGGAFLSVLGLILMWLYVKRNYNTSFVPLIISLAVLFISPFISFLYNKLFLAQRDVSDVQYYTRIVISSIISMVLGLLITGMYAVIFMKNKDREKYVPSFWIFRLLEVVSVGISILLAILSIVFYQNDYFNLISMIINFIVSFQIVAAAIYLFLRSKADISADSYEAVIEE